MEGLVSDRLKHYSFFRSNLLEKIKTPHTLFQNNAMFHCSVIFTTVLILIVVFAETKSLTLFSFHPICMSIGSLIFLAEGIIAYRNNGLLDTLSPIMQHSKRTKVRSIHQSMQMIGGVFLALGILIIIANKLEYGKSILPLSVHSVIGTLVIFLVVVQIVTGQQKLHQMDVSNSKIRRWHGDAGLLIWDLLCVAILSGLVSFLTLSVGGILTELCVVAVWFAVHAQMNGHRSSGSANGSSSDDVDDSDGPNNIDNDFVDRHFADPEAAPLTQQRDEEGEAAGGRDDDI